MKRIFILISILPLFANSFIPGVSLRGNYLYISETEISNQHYTDFLRSISDEDSIKNQPNSELWEVHKHCESMVEYYFQHPAYQYYPVVNVTHEQASAYCDWLTKLLNKTYTNQKVLVRLPTEKEWEYAAKEGNQFAIYPWGHETMRVKKGKHQGKFQANFVLNKGNSMMDGATITAPVYSYWPNDYGLYNMAGNVAEMVAEKGLVKGGSWRNRADWLQIQKQQYVYSASPEVGFRYVVEVIKLPQPKKKPKPIKLDKKFFRKYFAKINDSLSVGKYEVTNQLFMDFINHQCGDTTKHQKVYKNNWNNLFPYSGVWSQNYADHPDFYNHPVVNVDYESVTKFCSILEWHYERAYGEKVEIRLPTVQEWELAALGGIQNSAYPWGGSYLRNKKGCYLANFNPKMSEDENVHGYDTLTLHNFFNSHFSDLHDYDGEAVIAPVDSYYPNNYGLYNMAGNVAEMVLDSNFTKGGSWKSKSSALQIDSKEEWDKQANPFTGFRVVMVKKKP